MLLHLSLSLSLFLGCCCSVCFSLFAVAARTVAALSFLLPVAHLWYLRGHCFLVLSAPARASPWLSLSKHSTMAIVGLLFAFASPLAILANALQ